MPEDRPELSDVGYYFALAQVGLEMAAPIIIGVTLDIYLGWRPWGVVVGAVVGFVGGLTHLIMMVNRHDSKNSGSGKHKQ